MRRANMNGTNSRDKNECPLVQVTFIQTVIREYQIRLSCEVRGLNSVSSLWVTKACMSKQIVKTVAASRGISLLLLYLYVSKYLQYPVPNIDKISSITNERHQ